MSLLDPILKVAGSTLFGLLGLSVVCAGIGGFYYHSRLELLSGFTLKKVVVLNFLLVLGGCSMLSGAVLLWSQVLIGVVLGIWPAIVAMTLKKTSLIRVIPQQADR